MQLLRHDRPLTPSWDLVRPSIALLRTNIWPVFYLSFLPSLTTLIGLVLMGFEKQQRRTAIHWDGRVWTGLAIAVIGSIMSLLAYPGFMYLLTQAVRGGHPTTDECFRHGLPKVVPFIGMMLIVSLAVGLGIIAFIIPGVILIRGFFLAPYKLIEENIGPVEALRQSFDESKPHAGWIWGVIGVAMAFAVLGSILRDIPIIGYLLSLSLGYLYVFAPALRYAEIHKKASPHTTKKLSI